MQKIILLFLSVLIFTGCRIQQNKPDFYYGSFDEERFSSQQHISILERYGSINDNNLQLLYVDDEIVNKKYYLFVSHPRHFALGINRSIPVTIEEAREIRRILKEVRDDYTNGRDIEYRSYYVKNHSKYLFLLTMSEKDYMQVRFIFSHEEDKYNRELQETASMQARGDYIDSYASMISANKMRNAFYYDELEELNNMIDIFDKALQSTRK